MTELHKLQLFVENRVGVLDQISVLIRRSGWNIKSIHSCEEPWNSGTRVILLIEGRAELRLLISQLNRLDCMKQCFVLDQMEGCGYELVLVKGCAEETAIRLGAVPLTGGVFQFSGTAEDADRFVSACLLDGPVELMRSGAIFLK